MTGYGLIAFQRYVTASRSRLIALLLLSLLCCIAGVALLAFPNSRASAGIPENVEWITLQRGDFEVLYRDEGELRPVKVTALTFLRWGKISYLIPEGTAVKQGDRIVSLETKEIEDNIRNN